MTGSKGNDGYVKGKRLVGRSVTLRSPAKVNLHLEVLRQRHDGYHEIETILQAVAWFDQVRVTLQEQFPGGEPVLSLTISGDATVPVDETNLAWQAARLFCRTHRVSGRLDIELEKSIPPGAGLGGGSGNAAAVLVACDRLFDTRLEIEDLQAMGAKIGADVPFFITGGASMARGIGTRLTPLPSVKSGQFLIVKPPVALSTSDVYRNLKMGLTVNSPKANIQVIKSLLARFPQKAWPGFNRLEEVVLPSYPVVQRIVHHLRTLTPVAMLSGSGSAVFGVFREGYDLTGYVGELEAAGMICRVVGPHAAGVEIMDG